MEKDERGKRIPVVIWKLPPHIRGGLCGRAIEEKCREKGWEIERVVVSMDDLDKVIKEKEKCQQTLTKDKKEGEANGHTLLINGEYEQQLAPRTEKKETRAMTEKRFPYLIMRLMASVYQPFPIVFVPDDSIKPEKGTFTLVIPEPYDAEGNLTEETRKTIIGVTLHQCKKTGLRMCVVFGETECVFCEPDGSQKLSNRPPQGGCHIEPDGKVHRETFAEA